MIKQILLIFGLLAIISTSYSQQKADSAQVFVIVEKMPEFKGGQKGINDYLQNNIKYPKMSAEKDIAGSVYVGFIINEFGEVRNAKIIRGVDSLLNNEALRVISEMPRWEPGLQDGKAVSVSFVQKINFKIQRRHFVVTTNNDTIYGKMSSYITASNKNSKVWLDARTSHEKSFKIKDLKSVRIDGTNYLVKPTKPWKKRDKNRQLVLDIIQEGDYIIFKRVVPGGYSSSKIVGEDEVQITPIMYYSFTEFYLYQGNRFIDKYKHSNYKEIIKKYFTSCPRFLREVEHNRSLDYSDVFSVYYNFCK